MSPPTRLFLLRHGHVCESWDGRLYGALDVPLSARGREQSRLTAGYLAAEPIARIVSSDLDRAAHLADSIAAGRELPAEMVPTLRERCFGGWQGVPLAEIPTRFPEAHAAYFADRINYRVDDGAENFHDTRDRVMPVLDALLASSPGETVCLVAHSGPVRVILADALGMPMESLFRFAQDHCCINLVEYGARRKPLVRLLNHTGHLGALATTGDGLR